MTNIPALKIIPVNEPNGEGNGWNSCPEELATGFEVDDGEEVIEFFSSRKEAENFIANATGK